jgi:alpha-tubulin suppressor-like RCC1 family protein
VDVSGGQTYSKLAVGTYHSCLIATGGGTYCWGYNSSGELGDGSVTLRTTPVPVTGGAAFVDIAVGDMHSCGLTAAGQIQCWGSQYNGSLGDGVYTDSPVPLAVAGGLSFTDLAIGAGISSAACGIVAGGNVYCWPYGSSRTPVLFPGGVQFASLQAGGTLLCGIALTGEGYCWGANDQGQLGTGSISPPGNGFARPQLVTGGFQFASIAAGSQHGCGLTTGGVAYCWGDNSSGQLGAAGALLGGIPYPVKVMGQP